MNSISPEYTVVILCCAHNHVSYIEDALKGFLMQQTNFPFVVCVVDDCSNDGTTDIIKQYEKDAPLLIKGCYFDKNHYSEGEGFLYNYLSPWIDKTKYVAFCEGDDYWTDPLKLQKQVDFMEKNDCDLTFHRVIEHWQDSNLSDKELFPIENRRYTATEIFLNWIVATASVMVSSEVFMRKQMQEVLFNSNLMCHDQVIYMLCAMNGGAVGLRDTMAVYRRLQSGYTLNLYSNLEKSCKTIKRYCLHYAEMKNLFGEHLGKDFIERCDLYYVRKSLNGCYLSIRNKDLHEAFSFLIASIQNNSFETIRSLIILSAKAFKRIIRLC